MIREAHHTRRYQHSHSLSVSTLSYYSPSLELKERFPHLPGDPYAEIPA
jgi:hypothetical protein